MSNADRPRLWALPLAAALLAGCASEEVQTGRQHEVAGDDHLAYEQYLAAARANPDDGAAAAGLRRTAGKASAFWLQRGVEATDNARWTEAAMCHLKVLQIEPSELSSTWALRQITKDHPEAVAAAQAAMASRTLSGELLAMAGVATEETPRPADQGPATRPAGKEPKPRAKPPADTTRKPKPKPKPARRVAPADQKPTVRREPGTAKGDFLLIVRVSDDDDRYPEKRELEGGLAIEVKDTDRSPLDADMAVYLDRKRLAKLKDLRIDTVIGVVDRAGRPYEIVIMDIDDDEETVKVGLRKAPRPAKGGER